MHERSLFDLRLARIRIRRELMRWARSGSGMASVQAAGKSFNRGVQLMAELVAVRHEIAEREEQGDGHVIC